MIPDYRTAYNQSFTPERYQKMLDWITEQYQYAPNFHVAETPVFLPPDLEEKLRAASADVNAVISAPGFLEAAEAALLPGQQTPGRTERPLFLQMDFGLCEDGNGGIIPQLIEAQGFPSLYFFQDLLSEAYQKFMPIPEGMTSLFGGLEKSAYRDLLRRAILAEHDPQHVVLLEIEPKQQATRIDFVIACQELGIAEVCISDVILEGNYLYYELNGRKTRIKRIFNRVIFDELQRRPDLERQFNLVEEVEVEWAGHPDWFFMISKHTLPSFDSPYVPSSFFLHELHDYPEDLQNYVLKPLYSFAGSGVILHPTEAELRAIKDPQNYILQRKVKYADLIPTLDVPARAEVRLMYLWLPEDPAPVLINNLVRLSKGEMVGVRYNKGKTWVGGSIGFMKK